MRLQDAIRHFLEHCEIEKNQSKRTLISYTHYLERFADFSGNIEIDKIDQALIKKYRLFLNRYEFRPLETLSVKTQNYHIIALRAFLKYCIKNDWETLAPEKIDLAKIEDRSVEYLTREELERLFEAVDTSKIQGLRNRAIMEMLYSTGLRISELVNLDIKDIDFERGEFAVRGKGKKMRIVFLSKRAKKWLEEYLNMRGDTCDPLFLNHGRTRKHNVVSNPKCHPELDSGSHPIQPQTHHARNCQLTGQHRRLTEYSIQEIVRAASWKAGLTKNVTPHTLRHSFATELLMNGADIRSVQEMLGHSSITTTQIYTHITNKKLREVHEKFHK